MIIQFIFLNLMLVVNSYGTKNQPPRCEVLEVLIHNSRKNQEAFDLIQKPNILVFPNQSVNDFSKEWGCSLKHDHTEMKGDLCLQVCLKNSKSRKYIAALLGVLSQSCTANKGRINVNDSNKIKDFILEQPIVQKKAANKDVRERASTTTFKQSLLWSVQKELSDYIEELLQSVEQDKNCPLLYFIDTQPIEDFFIVYHFDEIQEKREQRMNRKRVSARSRKETIQHFEVQKKYNELFKIANRMYTIVDRTKSVTDQTIEKPKSFFARIIGFFSWWRK